MAIHGRLENRLYCTVLHVETRLIASLHGRFNVNNCLCFNRISPYSITHTNSWHSFRNDYHTEQACSKFKCFIQNTKHLLNVLQRSLIGVWCSLFNRIISPYEIPIPSGVSSSGLTNTNFPSAFSVINIIP